MCDINLNIIYTHQYHYYYGFIIKHLLVECGFAEQWLTVDLLAVDALIE